MCDISKLRYGVVAGLAIDASTLVSKMTNAGVDSATAGKTASGCKSPVICGVVL
jgi:hypothetical protein